MNFTMRARVGRVTSSRKLVAGCPATRFATRDAVERSSPVRLTRKFIAALVIGVALVALIQGWFDYQRERDTFDKQMRAEATALGRALARGMAEVWTRDGEAAAREFLLTASSQGEHIKARWIWLDSTGREAPRAPRDELTAMADDQVVVIRDPIGSHTMLTYIPVDVPEPREGGLEIAQPLSQVDAYTRDSLRLEILGTTGGVAVAAALALFLGVAFIGRPISRLVAKARRVGAGDLSGPLRLAQRDELGELANEINLMCERLAHERGQRAAATEQLRHADRLTTVGKLASGIAHELGTPLNVVSGRARLIADREVDGQDVQDSARIVVEQAERMTALIRQLLDFARPRPLQKAPVNLTALAARVCELVATIAKKANVTLVPPPAAAAAAVADADDGQLTQVLTNLIVNAAQSMQGKPGTVTLATAIVERVPPADVGNAARTWATVAVRDTGSGMDAKTRERIFEPFFTTKQVGEGTGLGLSVSWGLVREHGGWIEVESAVGAGSTFTVYLPAEKTT
jgi:signal transduction histidine kinase